MRSPRIASRLVPAVAIAVLATLPVVGPAAAADDSCTHVQVRLTQWPTEDLSGQTYLDDPPILYWGVEGAGSAQFTLQVFGHYCGPDTNINIQWATDDGTAVAGSDYTDRDGSTTVTGADTDWGSHDVTVPITNPATPDPESAVEYFIARISGGHALIAQPSQAPVFIVDNDGTDRVTLPPDHYDAVSISELTAQYSTGPDVQIPVFRAGPAAGTISVPYTVTGGSGVTDGDYNVLSPAQLEFTTGERVEYVKLELIDDLADEANETLTVTVDPPTGVGEGTTTNTVTIVDNDTSTGDNTPPATSFHHPLHNKTYESTNYLARTIHVFAPGTAQEPSGIDWVQTALRKTKMSGACAWWNGSGWSPGSCGTPRWLQTWFFDTFDNKQIWEYPKSPNALAPLKPSIGTKVKNYYVYARAADKAGNVETSFQLGRNKNRFEVKPG